jgi:hypothetical protein
MLLFPWFSTLSVKHDVVSPETTDEVSDKLILPLLSLLLLSSPSSSTTGISCLITGRDEEEEGEEEGEEEEREEGEEITINNTPFSIKIFKNNDFLLRFIHSLLRFY